ncbi:MAG: transporter substrate-binding domain-containing protein [Candidatus Pacebacteria bacterium]|nr:transporter substrate-binding domain-containing protein [Candidatus Paceibacterota bacterium]
MRLEFLIVLTFFIAFAGVGVVSAEEVIASGHPDWSPVMLKAGDKIVGIGPDLVTKVMDDLGLETNCSYSGPWDRVQVMGIQGDIDVIVAAYKTEERQKYFAYSDSYFDDPIGLFAAKQFAYSGKESLLGHSIAVTKGDSYGSEIDEFLVTSLKEGKLTLSEYPDVDSALASLEKESDAMLYSAYAGRTAINEAKFKNVKEVAIVGSQPFYILISKKSKYVELLPQVNNLIALYKGNGELDKLIEEAESTGYL